MVKSTVTVSVPVPLTGGGINITNVGVLALISNPRHSCANVDVAHARRSEKTRISANGGVVTGGADVVQESGIAQCGVRVVNIVFEKRSHTYGYVAATTGVAGERGCSVSRVAVAGAVADKCVKTDACVAVAGSVALECVETVGRVLRTDGVAKERASTNGGVRAGGCIAKERVDTNGRVAVARGVSAQRIDSVGGVEAARAVDEKVKRSVGRVCETCSVAQKRPRASGCDSYLLFFVLLAD